MWLECKVLWMWFGCPAFKIVPRLISRAVKRTGKECVCLVDCKCSVNRMNYVSRSERHFDHVVYECFVFFRGSKERVQNTCCKCFTMLEVYNYHPRSNRGWINKVLILFEVLCIEDQSRPYYRNLIIKDKQCRLNF